MALTPSERVRLIQMINAGLDSGDWETALVILETFGVSVPSSYNWNDDMTPRTWALTQTNDETLVRLGEHFGAEVLDRPVSLEAQQRLWLPDRFRLFLSHIYENRAFVMGVKNHLWNQAVSAFVAHHDIAPTRVWREEIENALNSCQAAAAFLHPGFHASKWTDQEVGFAIGRGLLIVPLCLGEMPYGIMEKFQGIRAEHLDERDTATAIVDNLIDNEATQVSMAVPSVNRFEQADSPNKAQNWIRRLERFASLPQDLLQRISNAYARNSAIAEAYYMQERIAALLDRHGYEKPAPSYDDYGEEPF